jgi:Polyketide cyclase / dehydrase and lipid transport
MTTISIATVDAPARATPERCFAVLAPIDPTLYYPKYGPLPAVTGVRNQSGSWDTRGRTRTLDLSDGGFVVETITRVDASRNFDYELSNFQKLFGVLVSSALAEWSFEPVGGGTNIHWAYSFHARPGRGWIVKLIVGLWWAPYMRRVLPPIIAEIERGSAN